MSVRQFVLSMNCLLLPGFRPVPILLFLPIFLFFSSGCSHVVQEDARPPVVPQSSYSLGTSPSEDEPFSQWWQVFNDPLLNGHIQRALKENFSLKEGYARLKQARYFQIQADSHLSPGLDGRVRGESDWDKDS